MWLENLKELKKTKGMTSKQIADATKIPESTIKRIFSGDTIDPYVTTIHRIVTVLGGSLDHILADSSAVLTTESFTEVKESIAITKAERDVIATENEQLKAKNTELNAEIEMLKKELGYKEELLSMHRYYKGYIEKLTKYIEELIKKEGI